MNRATHILATFAVALLGSAGQSIAAYVTTDQTHVSIKWGEPIELSGMVGGIVDLDDHWAATSDRFYYEWSIVGESTKSFGVAQTTWTPSGMPVVLSLQPSSSEYQALFSPNGGSYSAILRVGSKHTWIDGWYLPDPPPPGVVYGESYLRFENSGSVAVSVAAVPLPGGLILLASGLGMFGATAARTRRVSRPKTTLLSRT